MEHKNAGSAKPVLQMREKRKFNWLVLALLLAVIAVGGYWLLV